MLAKLLRFLILLAFVSLAVWAVMIVYWRVNNRLPSTQEIALDLIVLPLAATCGYFLLKGVIEWTRRPSADGAGADSAKAATSAADPAALPPERLLALELLAAELRTPAGDDAEALAAALAEGQRPGLDEVLRDDNGFPVHAARIALDSTEETAQALAQLAPAGEPAPHWSDERLRALTLAGQVLANLVPALQKPAAPSLDAPSAPSARLQWMWLLPAGWDEPLRALAARWLVLQVERAGLTVKAEASSTVAVADAFEALDFLDRLVHAAHANPLPAQYVVLACDSALGEDTISDWSGRARLFSAKRSEGQVPGEAAVALLLRKPPADSTDVVAEDAPPLLRRMAQAERSHPASASGKTSTTALEQALTGAAANGAVTPADVALLVSDADARPSRQVEVATTVTQRLPQLDFASQCLHVGVGCGVTGPAATLAAVALARAKVAGERKPALVLSVDHPLQRAALMVVPAMPPPATDAPGTA